MKNTNCHHSRLLPTPIRLPLTAYRLLALMIPHPIRLRQPWDEVPASQSGRTAYRRRFNRPSGLDAWESVTLEIDRVLFCGEAALNGTPLGKLQTGELFAVDITSLLQDSNELIVEVDPNTAAAKPTPSATIYIVDPNEPPGSPIGEARLVIRTVSSAGD